MEDKHFRYIGVLIIVAGLIGMLFIMKGNLMGYAVLNKESNSSEFYNNGQMLVSKIGNIVGYEGGKLSLEVNVRNIGKTSLTNCQLNLNGEMISWMYSDKVNEIKSGETADFLFNINIPSHSALRDYNGMLEVKCNESAFSQNISIKVLKGLGVIKINELKSNENKLNVSYSIDRSYFIGENIGVDIWIVNSNGTEIKRIHDLVKLNKQGIIERNISIETDEDLNGNYLIYLAFSDDLNNFIEQSVVSRNSITGMAVAGELKNNVTGYIVFGIIVVLGLLFAFKGSFRRDNEQIKEDKEDENAVNSGLLDMEK